jgi:hypothetical protein
MSPPEGCEDFRMLLDGKVVPLTGLEPVTPALRMRGERQKTAEIRDSSVEDNREEREFE